MLQKSKQREFEAIKSAISFLNDADIYSEDVGRSIEYNKLVDILENIKRDIQS